MSGETDPLGDPQEGATEKDERMKYVASFAGFLTSSMIAAVSDTPLRWSDVVYAAGLAIKAIGSVAVSMSAARSDEGEAQTEKMVEERIDLLLARARATKVNTMKMDSVEELDAYMDGQQKGFH